MWLILPGFSPSSPADTASTSPSNSLFQELAQSALWRGTSKPPEFWRRAWKRATWLRRLSGLTCEPLTATRGVERWISSLVASLVPTSHSPASGPASTGRSPGSGESSSGSFARWDPDSYSWRTSQLSLLGDSTAFSETLPTSGSMRSGRLFQREPVVPLTGGTGSSSWPTAAATDWKGSAREGQRRGQLSEAAEVKWPTPRATDGSKGGPNQRGSSGDLMLPSAAAQWPTPAASSYGRNKGGANPEGPERPSLDTLARTWPTPRASESENRTTRHPPSVKDGRGHGRTLAGEAASWPTPTSGDSESSGSWNLEGSRAKLGTSLTDATCRSGPPAPETPHGETAPTLALNPRFVETLMGWPVGWTDCESSGMVSSRFRERWRSYLFSIVPAQGRSS